MNEVYKFSICLKNFLVALNISNKQLANFLKVDPSLISKWINGKRIPPKDSEYINLIVEYVYSNILNSIDKRKVLDIITLYEYSLKDDNDIKDTIRDMFLRCYRYSIQEQTSNAKQDTPYKEDYLFSSKTFDCFSQGFSDNDKIIMGTKSIILKFLMTLKKATKVDKIPSDSILLTYNSDWYLMNNYNKYSPKIIELIFKLLNNGWHINMVIFLNEDLDRTIEIIKFIKDFLKFPNFSTRYYKGKNVFPLNGEIAIVPEVGGILALATKVQSWIDGGFYFENFNAIKLLYDYYVRITSKTFPLFTCYSDQKNASLYELILKCEENLGNRYLFKESFAFNTIPIDIYEKCLRKGIKSIDEIYEKLNYYKRRKNEFMSQIKSYKFKDIYLKESIERFIEKGEYIEGDYYIHGLKKVKKEYIKSHLEYIVKILKREDNYEIAIVDKDKIYDMELFNFMIKEGSTVIVKNMTKSEGDRSVILESTEPLIVTVFEEYFMSLWDKIPSEYKDKEKIILWLNKKIKGI